MARRNDKTLELYANTVIDYLNAANLNEALFGLLDNIEKAFGFCEGWATKAALVGFYCDLEARPKPSTNDCVGLRWMPSWSIREPDTIYDIINQEVSFILTGNLFESSLEILLNKQTEHELAKWTPIAYIVDLYNTRCKPRYAILFNEGLEKEKWWYIGLLPLFDDTEIIGTFIQSSMLDADGLTPTEFYKKAENGPINQTIRADLLVYSLVFCFVQFITANDNNRFRIKKCPYCNRFFVGKSKARERCYSQGCEKAYQREKKEKQRDKDPVKYV